MERKTGGFDDKLLSKIGKIDRRRLRDYIAQLLSRKNFFEAIFDHLNEAVIVTDGALRIAYHNAIARTMLLWPKRRAAVGESLEALCAPGPLRDALTAMRKRPRRMENLEIDFGGEAERQLTLTTIPVQAPESDSEGAPKGTLWVFLLRDTTERRRRIEEEDRSRRLASLALLTSGVAHEIKNPLNSLNLHAQIMLQAAQESSPEAPLDKERVERASRVILEESQRLTQIVNEFIQAARPQKLVFEPKYLNRILEDLARVFRPECERLGIDLILDLEHDLPPMALDAPQMFQALRNLVRNAIEAHQEAAAAAPAGKPQPRRMILLRTRHGAEAAEIEIADNGPGIAEERLEKIFEPYYTTKFGGTGLGLMVVYRVVAEHGGEIHVDSRPGVGTRFSVTLPLAERRLRLLDSPAPSEPASVA